MQKDIKIPDGILTIDDNWIEKGIRTVFPRWGLSRLQSKIGSAFVLEGNGGYNTRGIVKHGAKDADGDILFDLKSLRSSSRQYNRLNPIAKCILDNQRNNAVGTGLTLQSILNHEILGISETKARDLEKTIEFNFNAWASSVESDHHRTKNFYGQQSLAASTILENGDGLTVFRSYKRPGSPFDFKIQQIEADRVSNPHHRIDTEKISAGVEKKNGAPRIYHVSNSHPGSTKSIRDRKWKEVKAFNSKGLKQAILPFVELRVGQTRGVPILANVMKTIELAGDYISSEQKAAYVGSLVSYFIKTDNPQTGDLSAFKPQTTAGGTTSDKKYKMGHGSVMRMNPGEDLVSADPKRPNTAFADFMVAVYTIIGMGVGQPMEVMIKRYNSNYTAANAAIVDAWKTYLQWRYFFVESWIRPVFEFWFNEAVAMGIIDAPGFFDNFLMRRAYLNSDWLGLTREHVDPVKDAIGARTRIENKTSNVPIEAAKIGHNAEEVAAGEAAWLQTVNKLGLSKESEAGNA